MAIVMVFFSILLVSVSPKKGVVHRHSVLKVDLNHYIPELTDNVDAGKWSWELKKNWGIYDIKWAIERAAADDKIEGLYLHASFPPLEIEKLAVLQDALDSFRNSGKWVYAYGDFYSELGYLVSCASDSIFLAPEGVIDFRGFGAVVPFYKDMLESLEIEAKVFYAGEYKSATEPFRRNDMSPQNRLQLREYLNDVYAQHLERIARHRGISVDSLKAYAARNLTWNVERALEKGFVDVLGYESDVREAMRRRMGLSEKDKLRIVSLHTYLTAHPPKRHAGGNDEVAVVFAEGAITMQDEATPGEITSAYVKTLRDLRKKDRVKAVVLRINSPGGSGLVSDKILREIKRLKEAGKPVVVSMGNYAASGGYYIACHADRIVAHPMTLTGSIGVFGLLFNVEGFSNNILKVHWDSVRTNRMATAFTGVFEWTKEEEESFQEIIDRFYEGFLKEVAAGRKMSVDSVHAIAKGRIWSGVRAVQIGLVDTLGDLDLAIAEAARLADVDAYRVRFYPKQKNPFERLLEQLDPSMQTTAVLRQSLPPEWYSLYKLMRQVQERQQPIAQLPFEIRWLQ